MKGEKDGRYAKISTGTLLTNFSLQSRDLIFWHHTLNTCIKQGYHSHCSLLITIIAKRAKKVMQPIVIIGYNAYTTSHTVKEIHHTHTVVQW